MPKQNQSSWLYLLAGIAAVAIVIALIASTGNTAPPATDVAVNVGPVTTADLKPEPAVKPKPEPAPQTVMYRQGWYPFRPAMRYSPSPPCRTGKRPYRALVYGQPAAPVASVSVCTRCRPRVCVNCQPCNHASAQ